MNSNAPTRKVVKCSYGGTRSARIHPKGYKVCSIATTPNRQGIKKYNKRGVRKRNMKTNAGDNVFEVICESRWNTFCNVGGIPMGHRSTASVSV